MGVPASSGGVTSASNPNYCTRDELAAYLFGANDNANNDTLVTMAIAAASRAIDAHCDRRFWLDDVAVARTYRPVRFDRLDVDDIGSLDEFAIAIDNGGDGTFATIWTSGDYQLWPYNAEVASPEAEPWTRILAIGKSFPCIYDPTTARSNRVQVTARWGWPAVPALVGQACLIKAGRVYHRRNSPQGVAAFDDFGPVRISRAEDGDVVSMLEDYRKDAVLIR